MGAPIDTDWNQWIRDNAEIVRKAAAKKRGDNRRDFIRSELHKRLPDEMDGYDAVNIMTQLPSESQDLGYQTTTVHRLNAFTGERIVDHLETFIRNAKQMLVLSAVALIEERPNKKKGKK